jgi:hypothetical protein
MAALDRGTAMAAGASLLALALGACASANKEPREALPPRAVSTVRPEPPPPSEPPVAVPTPPAVIVIDEGGDSPEQKESLAEASARARAERADGPPTPVAVITDKNLAEFVKDQKLTVASPESGATTEESVEPPAAGGLDESEWRRRGREIRQRWKDAIDAVARLEAEAAALRTKFYSTDDPYIRDSRVKPEWDRVLAELEDARRQAEAGPTEVEAFLDEGRRAGALPGWLREGVELEPVPILQTPEGFQAVEPVVAEEPTPRP